MITLFYLLDEIGSLLNALCLFGLTSEALELQERFQQFLDSIQVHLVVIWPPMTQTSLTGSSGTLQLVSPVLQMFMCYFIVINRLLVHNQQ